MARLLDPKLLNAAKKKLDSGKSKQDTFEELLNEFDEAPLQIAKTIRFMPTSAKRKKYFPLSVLTSILLLSLVIIETIITVENGHPFSKQFIIFTAITLFIIYGMLKSNAAFHSGAGFLGASRLLIFGLHLYHNSVSVNWFVIFELTISILICALGFYLRTKLDSRFIIESESEIIDSTKGIKFPD